MVHLLSEMKIMKINNTLAKINEDTGLEVDDGAVLVDGELKQPISISLNLQQFKEVLRQAYFVGVKESEFITGFNKSEIINHMSKQRVERLYRDICSSIEKGLI